MKLGIEPNSFTDSTQPLKLKNKYNLELVENPEDSSLCFIEFEGRLSLVSRKQKSWKPFSIDFLSSEMKYTRQRTMGKNQPFAKALGISSGFKTVIDATAGTGKDLFMMLCLGMEVTAIEKSPAVAALLEDALVRANKEDPDFFKNLQVIYGDAMDCLKTIPQSEVIYLDPMFPIRKKSAASKKSMQLFQDIHGEPSSVKDLLGLSLCKALKRVVLKRPKNGAPVQEPISHSYIGKSVRYDMYLV